MVEAFIHIPGFDAMQDLISNAIRTKINDLMARYPQGRSVIQDLMQCKI